MKGAETHHGQLANLPEILEVDSFSILFNHRSFPTTRIRFPWVSGGFLKDPRKEWGRFPWRDAVDISRPPSGASAIDCGSPARKAQAVGPKMSKS